MKEEKKIYCFWKLIKELKEDDMFSTVSVTNENNKELMIFLRKNKSSYEVSVYKERNGKYYIPDEAYAYVGKYTDTDADKTFFFDEFYKACQFINCIASYKTRIFVDYRGNIFTPNSTIRKRRF